MVCYKGYFIYSSFQHEEALKIFDHYYFSGSPYEYIPDKRGQKFSFLNNFSEKDKYNYGYYFNSAVYGIAEN